MSNYKFFSHSMQWEDFIQLNWYDLPFEIQYLYQDFKSRHERDLDEITSELHWKDDELDTCYEVIDDLKLALDDLRLENRKLKAKMSGIARELAEAAK